jgi:hypothetical protein
VVVLVTVETANVQHTSRSCVALDEWLVDSSGMVRRNPAQRIFAVLGHGRDQVRGERLDLVAPAMFEQHALDMLMLDQAKPGHGALSATCGHLAWSKNQDFRTNL